MNSWYHAISSAKKWGGYPEDYLSVHEFIDSSKRIIGDVRHRSLYHHTEGIWLCQSIFGKTLTTSEGRVVPVRVVAERHVEEDLGWIPSPHDYIDKMQVAVWMGGRQRKEVSWDILHPKKEDLP